MIKILLLSLSIMIACARDIELAHAEHKVLGKSLDVNAKIIQLSDQKQQIVSRLGGHLEAYYVRTGQTIKKGDKIAQIQSLELSKMTANYIALNKEMRASKKSLYSMQKLYKKGLASQQDVSEKEIIVASVEAKQNALKTQLNSLGIESKSLKKATDTFTIYSHGGGKIEKLLVSLHTNLNAQTPIISLVQESGYYAEAYLPMETALSMTKEVEAFIMIGAKTYPCKFVSLLPQVDEVTAQAKILFWIESEKEKLLLNAYAKMQIIHTTKEHFVVVRKSALSMFQGEWVVFVPKEEHDEHEEHAHHDRLEVEEEHREHKGLEVVDKEEEEHHDNHEGHDHEEHAHHDTLEVEEEHREHKGLEVVHQEKEEHHDNHEGHGHNEHEDEEVAYSLKVVKQIHSSGNDVAVLGIKEGEPYVSDGVYFVKSLLLKSKLGGHGH